MVHFDGGFEPNDFGTAGWVASALYVRFHPLSWLYLAARGDFFYEWVPMGAAPIFWNGSPWIAEGTATVDVRPFTNLSFRVEYRHDQAESPLFFRDTVAVDAKGSFIANARAQNTVTAGATAWF